MKKINQKGDTIVEILLSIAVLSFILTITYGLANNSTQSNRQSQERGEAQRLAEEQVELLRGFATPETPWLHTYRCFMFNNEGKPVPTTEADECSRGPNDRYNFLIEYDGANTYTVRTQWNNIKGGQDQLDLAYKLPITEDSGFNPHPAAAANSCILPLPAGPIANDCQRILDINAIYDKLSEYASLHGGKLPAPAAYGESGPGGWDYSSQGNVNFLNFLTGPAQPKDPLNNGFVGNTFNGAPGYAYGYICRTSGVNNDKMSLGAKLEIPAAFTGSSHEPRIIGDIYWYAPGSLVTGFDCTDALPGTPEKATITGSGDFPAWHMFNTENSGVKPVKSFTVRNPASSPASLEISTAFIAGANSNSFSIASNGCDGKTLAPNQSCNVDVHFYPPSGPDNNRMANAGKKNAILRVNNTNGVGSTDKALAGWAVTDRLAPGEAMQASSDNSLNAQKGLRAYNPTCYNDAFTCPKALILWNGGNLVLYQDANNDIVSNITGSTGAISANMQTDGNFVMRNSASDPVWFTGPPYGGGVWLMLYDSGVVWRMQPSWNGFSPGGHAYMWP